MKVTLECSMADFHTLVETLKVTSALSSSLWDFRESVRMRVKHSPESDSPDFTDGIEFARTKFFDTLEEHEIDLDALSELGAKAQDILHADIEPKSAQS